MPRFDKQQITLDQWYAHESLDRMFLVLEMYNQYVLDHPFVHHTPHLKQRAEQLYEDMAKMYHEIGREYSNYYED